MDDYNKKILDQNNENNQNNNEENNPINSQAESHYGSYHYDSGVSQGQPRAERYSYRKEQNRPQGQEIYQNQGSYQNQGAYQNQGGYQNQSAYQDQGGYQNQSAYQDQGGYQNQDTYQDQAGYQDQDVYQNQGNYQGQDSYAYQGGSFSNNNMKKSVKKKKSGTGKKLAKLVGCALIFGLVAGLVIRGVNVATDKLVGSSSDDKRIETTTSSKSDSTSSGAATTTDISGVVESVMPSVVSITSTIQSTNYFYGTQESEGAGSGFIIAQDDEKLMIATNNHVVEGSTKLTVGFVDGETANAEIVGTDSYGDLAVISVKLEDIKDDTASKIKVAVLGDSSELKVGQPVIAIGNALGYGQSVTTGVISAKDREVSFTDGTLTLLQTDAAINPGNSGGVLINLEGEVIGINNAKLADTDVEGMGYAIPISTANDTLNDIMNSGSVKEEDMAFLGIVGKTIDSTYSQALGIPSGAYVTQVVEDSPAEEAGINAGDVIVKMDDSEITSMEGLKGKLNLKKANTKVKITVKRANQNGEYQEKEIEVTLGRSGDYEDADQEESTEQQNQNNDSGQYYYNGNGNGGYMNPYEYFFGSGWN